jgi:hypothetical protein
MNFSAGEGIATGEPSLAATAAKGLRFGAFNVEFSSFVIFP